MIKTGYKPHTHRYICFNITSSSKHPACTGLGFNPSLRCDKPATMYLDFLTDPTTQQDPPLPPNLRKLF